MAKCNWDPSKHEGRPCPIHGSGMWDENILTRKDKIEKLKSKGYTQEEIEEELKDEKFDDEYDFEEWAKETDSPKEKHIAYIDTNKKYKPEEILHIVNQDVDNWDIQGGVNDVLMQHSSGATYVYDRETGGIRLTTREKENELGEEKHTKELTDYIQSAINRGETDPEKIYLNSPFSIHSHDEMVEIANKLLKNKDFDNDEEVKTPKSI